MAGGGTIGLEEAGDAPAGPVGTGERLVTLDFIRGIAVLGILFANIVAFAHPQLAYGWPRLLPDALDGANKALWLAQYVLIDGKMRGLFTLLFGAGMALFVSRAAARGNGHWLQARRLVWLGCFGLLHFYLLFWGDILALYALSGLLALPLIGLPARSLLGIGIVWYVAGGLFMAISFAGPVGVESGASLDAASAQAQEQLREFWSREEEDAAAERTAFTQGDYGAELSFMAHERTEQLGQLPIIALLETVPLILIGMALFDLGLFGGGIDPAAMRRWGWVGIAAGTAVTLPLGLWAMLSDFPPYLTSFVFNGAAQVPRLPVILGLAALLALWAPRASADWLGERLVAAGRMAFSNYIGTSILMMLVFRSWAGGHFGQLGRMDLLVPVLLGWLVMLAWSRPWLARFRYGPLEWCWRCLTYWRLFPFRR
jgi:uncharacterized protein